MFCKIVLCVQWINSPSNSIITINLNKRHVLHYRLLEHLFWVWFGAAIGSNDGPCMQC